MTDVARTAITRRGLLAAAGTGTILALAPVSFAAAATVSKTQVVDGQIAPGPTDFVHLRSTSREVFSRSRSATATPSRRFRPVLRKNSCDIGIFDARGFDFGGSGFRGWSGGFRTEFSISRTEATPGYLPGDVMPGTWHIVLGPYQVAPQGRLSDVVACWRGGGSTVRGAAVAIADG